MRNSHQQTCHTRCTTSVSHTYHKSHSAHSSNNCQYGDESEDSFEAQDNNNQDDDDWHIWPIRESITHRFTHDRRSTEKDSGGTTENAYTDSNHTKPEQHILRIARTRPELRPHRRASSLPLSTWSLLAILNLALMWCSQPTTCAFAPQSSPHRNHSNTFTDQLPSDSIVSSFLSSPSTSPLLSSTTLLFEELLQEQSLEEAIHKLTNAWNQVHKKQGNAQGDRPSEQMISSTQILVNANLTSTSNQTILERTRRWAKPERANVNKSQMKPKRSYEDMMTSDDSRAYEHDRFNRTKSNDLLGKERSKSSGNISRPLTAQAKPVTAANCTRCRQKDEARSLRLESVKFSILSKLGFQNAPNVSLKSLPRIPPISALLEQYGSSAMLGDDPRAYEPPSSNQKRFSNDQFGVLQNEHDQETDEYYVNTQKTIVFAQAPPPEQTVLSKLRAQYFKFPANVVNLPIQEARLSLYLKGTNSRKADTVGHIIIYKIVRGSTNLIYFQKKKISMPVMRRGGWIDFELTNLVAEWCKNTEDNLGLAIHSYDTEGRALTVIHQDDVSFESNMRPFMVVKIGAQVESIRRKRMTTLNCEEKSQEVRCCRYPLTIDFESFGWDWIIAPKRYEAHYCSGECSLVFMNGYLHTHLMQQSQLYNPTGPCCSPRKMSAISMLYMDDHYNIIYGILPNMVVDKCDCS